MPIEFANFGDQKFVDKTQLFQTTKLYEGGSIWKGFQEISEKKLICLFGIKFILTFIEVFKSILNQKRL